VVRERIFARLAFRAVGRAGSTSDGRMPNWAYLAPPIAFVLTFGTIAIVSLALAGEVHPLPGSVAPDLAPAAATVVPSPSLEGDILHVAVTIENRGDTVALAATIHLIDDRPNGEAVSIGMTPLPAPLAPGASIVVSTPAFVAAVVGPHTLTIRIDDVIPAELSQENNLLSIRMSVQPAAAAPPPSPSSEGIRVEAFQDLKTVAVIGIAIVAVFAAIAVLPPRPHDPGPLLPPPPEPPDQTPPPVWPP